MTEYRLGSTDSIYSPNVIAWAINGYHFADDRPKLLNGISITFPSVPTTAIEKLLSKAVPYTVEGETVVFSVDD